MEVYSSKDGYYITEGETFLYEITIFRLTKSSAELIASKFFKSKDKIPIKKKSVYKRNGSYIFMKTIDWLEAPLDYIIKNNLIKIDLNETKRRRRRRNSETDRENN